MGCGSTKEEPAKAVPYKVSVYQVSTANQAQVLSFSGTIEPENIAQVGFAVPGVINQISVEEGQYVTQGQLLASIDATEFSNTLAIANAGLEQAEDMYKRLNGLYEKGSLPAKDYMDIKTKVAQAKAQKRISAKHISDSRLYAPMSGIISAKMIERGSAAAPGVPAFTIIKTDMVYLKISVSESEVGTVKPGTSASIFIPTLQETFEGKISIINPQADAVSKTYSVKIKLSNKNGHLLPGMIAEAKITTGKNIDAITIPAQAIVRDADDITYVFVANGQKKAVRKRITAGAITGKNEIIVTDGLQQGDQVVISGQTRLKDGVLVNF
jgi:RND family efflux transporter MFP subunit